MIIVSVVVLYDCVMWSLTSREEYTRLTVVKNKILRQNFAPGMRMGSWQSFIISNFIFLPFSKNFHGD